MLEVEKLGQPGSSNYVKLRKFSTRSEVPKIIIPVIVEKVTIEGVVVLVVIKNALIATWKHCSTRFPAHTQIPQPLENPRKFVALFSRGAPDI